MRRDGVWDGNVYSKITDTHFDYWHFPNSIPLHIYFIVLLNENRRGFGIKNF